MLIEIPIGATSVKPDLQFELGLDLFSLMFQEQFAGSSHGQHEPARAGAGAEVP